MAGRRGLSHDQGLINGRMAEYYLEQQRQGGNKNNIVINKNNNKCR